MEVISRFVSGMLLVLALGIACRKQPPASAVTATPPDQVASAAPPSPRAPGFLTDTAATVVVTDTGNVDSTLEQLTLELRRYVLRTRSVPRNFEEFATKSQLQAPAAPAGKKYAIQGQAVVLVKR